MSQLRESVAELKEANESLERQNRSLDRASQEDRDTLRRLKDDMRRKEASSAAAETELNAKLQQELDLLSDASTAHRQRMETEHQRRLEAEQALAQAQETAREAKQRDQARKAAEAEVSRLRRVCIDAGIDPESGSPGKKRRDARLETVYYKYVYGPGCPATSASVAYILHIKKGLEARHRPSHEPGGPHPHPDGKAPSGDGYDTRGD